MTWKGRPSVQHTLIRLPHEPHASVDLLGGMRRVAGETPRVPHSVGVLIDERFSEVACRSWIPFGPTIGRSVFPASQSLSRRRTAGSS